ncbi:hypothetical protein JCM10207_006732 [Rhodosporidiobolus poonsookiae]
MASSRDDGAAPADAAAYGSAQARGGTALRPDYAAVNIAGSTTPLISPPATPDVDSAGGFGTDKYGGYGGGGARDSDGLLRGSSSAGRNRKGKAASLVDTLLKLLLAMFAVLALIVLLARMSFIPSPREKVTTTLVPYMPLSVANLIRPADGPAAPHPIIPLLTTANQKWAKKVASQSTTFDRATKTYKARYGLAPPPGFDKWFAFATQGRNHLLVDEYDQLMEDLKPFRDLTPQEIRRRTAELAQVPGVSIVSIRNGVAQVHSKSGKWAPALAFQQMLGAFVRDLPDMDVAINERPEGRVLPRQQRRVYMSDYGLEGDELAINATDPMYHPVIKGFIPEWKRDGSVWEAYRRSCPTDSAARRLVESVRSAESSGALVVQGRSSSKTDSPQTRRVKSASPIPVTREMTFSHDIDADFNVCDFPSLHTLHSAFYSDQRNIEYLYPIFSPSKPAGYADILIPSNHYWNPSSEFVYDAEFKKGRSKTTTDLDWDLKKSSAYWRGKVTRGADTPPGHGASFQKQRLVKMANAATTGANRVLVGFEPKTASLSSLGVPIIAANKASLDVAMACDPNLGECSYLRSLGYRVEPPAPMSEAWKHKFVLDIDEIGFSPRFFPFMESKSAVVKSSIQREFWRGWVQPWKHFIPLSSSYSELYNLQTFFEGFPPSLVGQRGNHTISPTVLTHPSPVPELPLNADGTPFDTDKALKDIADAGREWRETFVRKADMECYVYRLLIEYANLVTIQEDAEPLLLLPLFPLLAFVLPAVLLIFERVDDDTADSSVIAYSTGWVTYRNNTGSVDATAWYDSTFHSCNADSSTQTAAGCNATYTFTGPGSLAVIGDFNPNQRGYYCILQDEDTTYPWQWWTGSSLTALGDASVNHTRCEVSGLQAKKYTLTFGQPKSQVNTNGITLDYFAYDNTTAAADNLTWSSEFIAMQVPDDFAWSTQTRGPVSSTTSASASFTSATSSATATSSSSGGTNTTAIGVGVGVGVGCALGIALALLWFFCRRRRSSTTSFKTESHHAQNMNSEYGGGRSPAPVAESESDGTAPMMSHYAPASTAYRQSHYGGTAEVQEYASSPVVPYSSPGTVRSTGTGAGLDSPGTFRER